MAFGEKSKIILAFQATIDNSWYDWRAGRIRNQARMIKNELFMVIISQCMIFEQTMIQIDFI